MTWPTPQYSKSQVTRAGKTFLEPTTGVDEWLKAYVVIENWRACHGYPINTFQATLRNKLKNIDKNALVSQRLKRFNSILNKLNRFPGMNLARMQDFGGLRAVVSSMPKLHELERNYRNSRFQHELVSCRDYISSPKESGYRSVHLVYRYKNTRAPEYNGLFIELQLRTKLQHAWATTVETMGTFLDQALKSSEGHKEWLDYFSLCGAAFSCLEKTPVHKQYSHMAAGEIYNELLRRTISLKVKEKLAAFSVAARNIHVTNRRGAYHLITLKIKERRVYIQSYSEKNLQKATEDYARVEVAIANGSSVNAVLVSASDLRALKQAYPSYFLDSREFIKVVERIERQVGKNANM